MVATLAVVALGGAGAMHLTGCPRQPSPETVPRLGKLGELGPVTPPPAPPAVAVAGRVGVAERFGGTVEEAAALGCSTELVRGLSEQILAEANCASPGAFVALPPLPQVTLEPSVLPYLAAPAHAALLRALSLAPHAPLRITSMLRTVAQQYLLRQWYRRGRCGVSLAALPGASRHQRGLAVDVAEPERWRRPLGRAGFRWMGARDRWHFDFGKPVRGPSPDVAAFQRLWSRNHPEDALAGDGRWSEATERRLRRAPAAGFAVGPGCG
jgi:hypothetical protein